MFFRHTVLGTAIRACADNYTGALVVGLDVKHLYALTFGLGAACVGAAGVMLILIVDVTPSLGPAYTLLAFVIVITGGLGSMPGALLGGVLIGLTEAMAGLLFLAVGQEHVFALLLCILVLVLLFRPQQAIHGKKTSCGGHEHARPVHRRRITPRVFILLGVLTVGVIDRRAAGRGRPICSPC